MTIRRATEYDMGHWLKMRDSLWPESSATNKEQIKNYFSNKSTAIRECFLVEEQGVPIGFVELNIRNYAEGSDRQAVPYVEGWFVDEAHRGKGLGRSLMDRAETWAKENGYFELASDAEIENVISIAAHENLGFEETDRIVCFLKKLN